MALATGTRLGSYEVLAPLGAGGMGEVYRANDTRLKRQVAIKILPADLAVDAGRLARFQREAQVLASLNHPHVGAIYGIEESSGLSALVMELVEGPTLEDRIARGAIPVDEALAIARQIAEALEAAHEQGIVHRDLKPANIKVREDGAVKVLDFGLAKARDQGGELSSGVDLTVNIAHSPTMASPMLSREGVILGTAAYMSPEQAKGRVVDKRTDVWAFGAVLYEMLTGRRAFEGDDITELMAAVVKSTPDWSALPADLPPQVVTLIKRCLEKDRKTRIGDIAVARFLLSGDAAIGPPVVTAVRPRTPWLATTLIAAVAAAVGLVIGWWAPHRASSRDVNRLLIDVAPADRLTSSTNSGPRPARIAMALSPDGRVLVFAGTRGAVSQLYARPLEHGEATPLAGTENGHAPFFAPDGAWIGFIADNKIRKIPAAGGAAADICVLPSPTFWGASWGDDGNVYFAARAGIFKVASGGGAPVAVTTLDLNKGDRQLLPQLLPGGTLMFSAPPNLIARSPDGKERVVVEGASDGRYVATGHLLFMKNATLMAAPFDARTATVTGGPLAMVENLMHAVGASNGGDETGVGQYTVSASGTLVYATGGIFPMHQAALAFVDRSGSAQPLAGAPPRSFLSPRFSPDGRRIAVEIRNDDRTSSDIWVYDAARGSPTRVTFDGGARPVWSPDGKRIAYMHFSDSVASLFLINADGSGQPERLTKREVNQSPTAWIAAPETIAFIQRPSPDTFGIALLPMSGPSARTPSFAIQSRFPLTHADLSPDGQWIAYQSTESGNPEVYVQRIDGREKTRVSTTGGFEPIWVRSGREILFRGGPYVTQFQSAAVRSLSPFTVDVPRPLFESKPGDYDSTTPVRSWDASADGQRFLLMRVAATSDKPVSTLHVVLNWSDEVARRSRLAAASRIAPW